MKILAIRGKNIASLEGEFYIDFTQEPLLSTGIFAISGPTGSGKSTLLDTMCLALFAQTPRTMQAREQKVYVRDVNDEVLGQNDPRFLLRRGTVSGYAEVDFLGLTGYKYRARWAVGRARDKETGRLQNFRVTLHNLDKETEEQGNRSDIQKRIIELVGLTFEQFTRSVLLAQNDFSNFLKAEQGEKAALLEKLTGTEHYSRISRLVYEKTGGAKNAYDQVNLRIQGIELLPAEEESELTQRLKFAEKELERLGQLRISKQELTDRVKNAEKLIQLKKQQQKETTTLLNNALSLLVEANKQTEKEKEEYRKAEETYKKILPEIRQATQLDIEIRSYMPVLEEAKQQWQKLQVTVKDRAEQVRLLELNFRRAEDENKQLTEWFIRYRDKENVANQIDALLIHLDDASVIKKQLQQSDLKILRLQTDRKDLDVQIEKTAGTVAEKEKIKQITETKLKEEQKKIEIVAIEKVEKETGEIRKIREDLLIEKARFVTTGDIASLRDKLIPTEPCPVCGSCVHPYSSPAVHQEMESREKKIVELTLYMKELENQMQDYQKRQTEIGRMQQQLVGQEKEISQWKDKLSELQNKGKILAGQLETEQQLTVEQKQRMERSLQATATLFGNEDWQVNWLANPEGFRNTLVSFAEGWKLKKKKQEETVKQIDLFRAEWAIKKDLLQKEDESLKEIHKIYEEKMAVYNRLQKERGLLLEGKPARQVEEQLTTAIEQHRKKADEQQKIVQEQSTQVDRMKGVSGQVGKELEIAEKEWEEHSRNLQTWIEANNVSPEGFTIEQETDQLTRQKSELGFRLRTHTENLKKVESFQKELEDCRKIYDQWAKLNDLVGSADGAKFRRIAQGYTLDVLINYANVQLRNLTHRYRLERVPETLALQVIDRDMCDEVRTVHSLSGGESFLVSLALALGLSSLSSNRMKVESLFIDEGFGSLDSDTLRIAMDALESLRTQGRKIGVISHVQEMTERIPVQIKVCRSGNGRSYLDIL